MMIEEIIENNKATDKFFFSEGAMAFFNSQIESKLYGDRYFITSEIDTPRQKHRLYTVREAIDGGKGIKTVGTMQAYRTFNDAMIVINQLLGA